MSKFLGYPFWVLQIKGTCLGTWAWYPVQTPFLTLLFRKRLECSETGFRRRRFMSKFLGVFLFCSRGNKERTWEHRHAPPETPFWNSFSEQPMKTLYRTLSGGHMGDRLKLLGSDTVVSKIITPEFFSELIWRGVIYYAGTFYPKYVRWINSVGYFCITLYGSTVLGVKNYSENLIGIHFFVG